MMSYLWIVLLGSLLAAHAEAQDDAPQTEEAADPEIAPMTTQATPEVEEDSNAEVETTPSAEEIKPTDSEPEPDPPAVTEAKAEESADSTEPPATGDENQTTPAPEEEDTVTSAPEKGEAVTPAAESEGVVTSAPEDEQATTPAGDADAGATTTQAADSEGSNPDAEQSTASPEEKTTISSAARTPAPSESGADENVVRTTAAPVAEASTVKSVEEEKIKEKVTTVAQASVPPVTPRNIVPNENAGVEDHISSKNSRMLESDAGDGLGDNQLQSHSTGDDVVPSSAKGSADTPNGGGSNTLGAVLGCIILSAVGAVVGYFTYKNKKLCFKNRQEADPEAGQKADATGDQSEPQVSSTLLNSS
ncbi:uncharacterized protein KZ484_016368 isoform 3-T3 [Pholidichthys leucotaenia]